MNSLLKLSLVVTMLVSQNAWALVDGQLLIGQRSAKLTVDGDSETLTATEYKLAVHVDPIPFLPVAGGLYYIGQTFSTDEESDVFGAESFTGSQIGIEVMAWVPLHIYNLEPYAKLGYTFFGKYEATIEDYTLGTETGDVKTTYDDSGVHFSVGLRWNPIPLIGVLAEVGTSQETLKLDTLEFDGNDLDVDDADDIKVSSMAFLVGVEVGI